MLKMLPGGLAGLLVVALWPVQGLAAKPGQSEQKKLRSQAVSGTGIHYFSSAILHSEELTETGKIVRSTDTVELHGDLRGRILYHPTSVFDFSTGTLVNTGSQVFSGTVLDSGPLLLFDDEYRFEVDLETGVTLGRVYLDRRQNGDDVRCELLVTGPSAPPTPEGDVAFTYEGQCRLRD